MTVAEPISQASLALCRLTAQESESVQNATFVLTIEPEFARVRYVSLQTGWY
jgi:hypothetical protein